MAFKNEYKIENNIVTLFIKRKNGEIYEVLLDKEGLEKIQEEDKTVGLYFNTVGGTPYAKIAVDKKVIPIHRFILDYDGDFLVDHINNNSLDCRKENLRVTTALKNSENRKFNLNTEYKGIRREGKRWYSSKRFNGMKLEIASNSLEKAIISMEKIDSFITEYLKLKGEI